MNSELRHMKNPFRLRFIWVVVYILIIAAITYVVGAVAEQIDTHTLPVGKVQLTVPYSKYLVGETVSYTIKNGYNSTVYIVNDCPGEPLAVYFRQGGKWVRVHDQASLKDCPGEQRDVSVAAGKSISGNFAPWRHLFSKPGKYRIVASIEHYDSLPYQEFEVVAKVVAPEVTQTPATQTNSTTDTSTGTTTTTKTTTKTPVTTTKTDDGEPSEEFDD